MPRGSWLMYTWVDFKSDFVSPQHKGRRPSSPPEQNNGKGWHHVSVPGSFPAGAGDAFCSPGIEPIPQILSLCLWPFPGAGKLWVRDGSSASRCWDGECGARQEQYFAIRGNWILSAALCHFSLSAFWSLMLIIYQWGSSTCPKMIQGCVSQCLFNIYPIFTHNPLCTALH